jgi:acyl carrier protein
MTRDEVFERVRAVVADSLAVSPEEISPASRLIDALGADSLDFIDIVFTLEKEFDVRLREGELEFLTRLDFSSPSVMRDGFLTAETVDRLRPSLPALRDEPDLSRITPSKLFSFLTVESLVVAVERRLDPSPSA